MKVYIPVFTLLVAFALSSCSPKQEVRVSPPSPPEEKKTALQPAVVKHEEKRPPAPAVKPSPPETPRYKTVFDCKDETKKTFNSCGIDVLPFVRTAFLDVDKDGVREMIVGSKDGALRLYRNHTTGSRTEWRLVEDYFEGIQAGAFSAPAAGDIDGDGTPEIALGTGGFSSDSGRVLIYRNNGTPSRPRWKKIQTEEINVGNDAAPTLSDIDGDRLPDLIVGNSTGHLFLFRNRTKNNRISFEKDPDYFKGVKLGMYVVPAVTASGDKTVIVAGNDMGKVYLLERSKGGRSWARETMKISFGSFASPAFIGQEGPGAKDIVISEGNGQLYYFKNRKGNYREWEKVPSFFSGRILPGPACTPVVTDIGRKSFMIAGNINGELKLFEQTPSADGLPWVERPGFFGKIRLKGFSRGLLCEWQGKTLLVTGQQDGLLRAFLNTGNMDKPVWKEQNGFFSSLPKMLHPAPAVFDLDGDGRWELVVGDADGNIRGFRYEARKSGAPSWTAMEGLFRGVKVNRFASPALFRDSGTIYLLSGQQDGKIHLFARDVSGGSSEFRREGLLRGIAVQNHSSPTATFKNGSVEVSVGDYNGNLKLFACRRTQVEE